MTSIRVRPLSLLLAVATVTAAHAQATTSSVHAKAGTPAHTPGSTLSTTASSTAGATSAAATATMPPNVLAMNPSAMVNVNGKQVSAGSVQAEVKAQIHKQAGPPSVMKLSSGKRPPAMLTGSTVHGAASSTEMHNSEMPKVLDCAKSQPTIFRVTGSMSPGKSFMLEGYCFGDQIGTVKINGAFPAGAPQLVFTQWQGGKIKITVPAVSGAADQQVYVSVVTTNKRESAAKPIAFFATRSRVEVPAHYWTPGTHYEKTWDNLATKTPAETSPTPMSVTVNPACALSDMTSTATVGKVTAINGWSDGPPNVSNVQIAWNPQITITNITIGFHVAGWEVGSVAFDVKAWADCPVGVAP